MPSLKEIKTRIQSVNSTRKITSAMKMVASSKLHHAQVMIENMLPYETMIEKILKTFLASEADASSVLTQERPVKRVALVVYSSNSSLCGGFNANVIKNDWETKYIVGYYSWWYENSRPVGLPLQYSELLDMWRVTNFAFMQGTSCFHFLWNGDVTKDAELKLVTQSGEPQKAEIPTDLVHSKYGPVYTKWLSDVPTVYTAADKEFAIPFQWGVFIGSNWGDFGSGYDLFYLP